MTDYRYTLTREWTHGDGLICWVMLNPSTADDTVDDPTIRRVIRFSQDHGYQRLVVVNLFAARAIKPTDLIHVHNPVGPANDEHIETHIAHAHTVVWAWGASAPGPLSALGALAEQRKGFVAGICRRSGRAPQCLGVTAAGHPRHPLYVPAVTRLTLMQAVAA